MVRKLSGVKRPRPQPREPPRPEPLSDSDVPSTVRSLKQAISRLREINTLPNGGIVAKKNYASKHLEVPS